MRVPNVYYRLRRFLDLRHRRQWRQFERVRATFYETLWREAAANTRAEFGNWSNNYYRICRDGLTTVVNLSDVMLDSHLLLRIIGDKKLTYDLLSEKGFPVPGYVSYDADSFRDALGFLARQDGPVVVKPASGTGGGRGVTTGIRNERDLRQASRLAFAYGPTLLVEAQAVGNSYRLLYLGGAFIDAIRRDPPCLTGDGKRTVRQLVAAENRRRLTDASFRALSPLRMDRDCIQTLAAQGLTSRSVIAKGQRITVKQSVNENSADENHSEKDRVNPGLVATGSRLITDLGIRFASLDIICTDITVPLAQSGGIVNEINTTPGIHHHYLTAEADQRVPVAELLLDHMFANREGVLSL